MDVFRLLSRGAQFDKSKLNDTNFRSNASGPGSSNHDTTVQRELDFFRTKRTDRRKSGEEVLEENLEEVSSEKDDANKVSSAEDAHKLRSKLRSNVTGEDLPLPVASFGELKARFNLHHNVLRNLQQMGFEDPTPIQSEAIPIQLHGRDLIACAPTGSGKTLSYILPLVQKLNKHKTGSGPRGLIITPTKELAMQVHNELRNLSIGTAGSGSSKEALSACVFSKSIAARYRNDPLSRQKYDIIISTPLRLVGAIKDEIFNLADVEYIILDEADRLLDQGFLEQTDDILAGCTNPKLQKCLFSATMPSGVETLANSIMHDPIRVIIGQKGSAVSTIDQRLVFTGSEEGKLVAVRQMVTNGEFTPPVLIFVQSIQRSKALFHELIYDGLKVDVIHGERTPTQRNKIIESFRKGDIWVLICTDVLARGIDFHGVNLVINYDLPQTSQSYIHRIGRTGRAGRSGRAVTFFTKLDWDSVKMIVNVMEQSGCNVDEWLTKLKKLSSNDKKRLRRRPVERKEISTVPSVVRLKRRQHGEMIKASKARKIESDNQDDSKGQLENEISNETT